MNDLTLWKKAELYPALFDRIPEAFPELDFRRCARGWESGLKLDGSTPKVRRRDKTKVLASAPGYIREEGEDPVGLVDHVMQRDGVEFMDALRRLAEVAGLQVPRGDVDPEAWKQRQRKADLLEAAASYLSWCLLNAEGPRAQEVRDYLTGDRGYTMEEVEAMGLGFLPSAQQLRQHLAKGGHQEEEVEAVLGTDGRLGTSHVLAIPYRSAGNLLGFSFRSVKGEEPKYLNAHGMARGADLFNLSALKGDRDLVVVEGQLDALHAMAKGVPNVVAIASSSLSADHLHQVVRKGARKVTLFLDNDEPGTKGTDKALDVLQEFPNLRTYVVRWDGCTAGDADQLLREEGVEVFTRMVANASPAWSYRLERILGPYVEKQEAGEEITAKDLDKLLEDALGASVELVATDRAQFTSALLHHLEPLGITGESLQAAQERLRYDRSKEAQREAVAGLVAEVRRLVDHDPAAAIDRLQEGLKEANRTRGAAILTPMGWDAFTERMGTSAPALRTGFPSLDAIVRIPQAALTLVAGRPRHGKTTTMLNLALSMAEVYPAESFYFFSYEEPAHHILTKVVNVLLGEELRDHWGEYQEEIPTNLAYLRRYMREGRSDVHRVEVAKDHLRELIESGRFHVVDASYTVEELDAVLASITAGAAFIDYAQRIPTSRSTQDKRTEIGHVSAQLVRTAKATGLPLVVGAQINREGAGSDPRPPRLEHLKEAGNLEEDANLVLGLFNASAEREGDHQGEAFGRVVELEVRALKNRDGKPNAKAVLDFDTAVGKLRNRETF